MSTPSDVTLLDRLREISFLQGIGDEYLRQIAAVSRQMELPAGAVVFREGEPANDIYFVVEGHVSLEICAPGIGCRRILTVTGGELLGWSPVLERSRMTATARTASPTSMIQLNGRQIVALCEHNPHFGYEFMRRAAIALAKRLNATRLQLIDVYGSQMPNVAQHKVE